MIAAAVWFALSMALVVVSGIVNLYWNRARRHAGERVMYVFDRADASVDLPAGWVRIVEDDLKGLGSLLRRNRDPATERWRLVMWAVIGLWVLNIAFGFDIARRLTGT
jgi:hypothetical protein